MKLNINSEIGKLKKVLLHRPGKEVENFTPSLMARLLFDDIPYLKVAQEEHDYFADLLRKKGTEVYYIEDLLADVMKDSDLKMNLIDDFLEKTGLITVSKDVVLNYLLSLSDNKAIASKLIAGIRKDEIEYKQKDLSALADRNYPFVSDPLPNMYFTRDIGAVIENGISLNRMFTDARKRETLFVKYVLKYHPEFKESDIPYWYHRENNASIEGGDILVLSKELLAIGISQRTNANAIKKLASRIFNSDRATTKIILAFRIPEKRAFMHLDTVFTQVDHDKFTVHAKIEGPLEVYVIKPGAGGLLIEEENMSLEKILTKHLNRKVTLIRCGLGDPIVGGREQWNDGSNTLAISPGEVVVYARNYVTNQALKDHGVTTHTIKGSELSRGRGGPRCMSMPFSKGMIKMEKT